MDARGNAALWRQFGAAIDMLENAVVAPFRSWIRRACFPSGRMRKRSCGPVSNTAARSAGTIAPLTEERAHRRCGFERLDLTVVELHLYNMRHVQHHAAQLNLLLRQTIDSAPGWVAKTASTRGGT